jgi:riboflavin kinase/FMN adenylyltransferase
MQIIHGLEQVRADRAAAVTIGTFDGVHKGHRKIIREVIKLARAENLTSVVLTFEPHPRTVVGQKSDQPLILLTSFEEKINILQQCGIEQVVVIPFTPEFAAMAYQDFVSDVLVDKIRAAWIVVGHDHTFGRDRQGNFAALQNLSLQYQFRLKEVAAHCHKGQTVSSSRIRDLLLAGDVEQAADMLGYPYSLQGVVIPGKGRGRTLNFATANLELSNTLKLIPGNGVYAVDCLIKGGLHRGMANLGLRPTFGENDRSIEVHIFDFNNMIYGEQLQLSFLRRLRGEIKFKNETDLIRQLQQDKINSNQN